MRQPGTLLIYGIVLITIICSAAATADTEDCDPGLSLRKLAWNNVEIALNKTCNATDYDIKYETEQTGDEDCTYSGPYKCADSPCHIDTFGMGCFPIPIKPCSRVTYHVAGKTKGQTKLIHTRVAPRFKSTDWNLTLTTSGHTLDVSWGPPANPGSNDVSCATDATVLATCNATNGAKVVITGVANDITLTDRATATLSLDDCKANQDVTVTVTYILDIPTDTKETTTVYYKAGSDEGGCGTGCIVGILVGGLLLVTLVILCVIFRGKIMNRKF